MTLLVEHRLSWTVARYLSGAYSGQIPASFQKRLRAHREYRTRRALAHAAELARLMKIFYAEGIFALSIKGPLLSLQLFGDVAARAGKDLDIFIKPQDIERAHKILWRESYRFAEHDASWTPKQIASYRRWSKDYAYVGLHNRVCIELHWRFFKNPHVFTLTEQGLEGCVVKTQVLGAAICHFDWETNLIYLCCHGAVHTWTRLFWLVDIATLMTKHTSVFDWNAVMDKANTRDARRALLEGVVLAATLLGSPLPEPIEQAAKSDGALQWRLRTSLRKMEALPRFDVVGGLILARRTLKMHSTSKHKIFSATRYWHPSFEDWDMVRLPDRFFGLYYVLRPFLATIRYCRRKWRRG